MAKQDKSVKTGFVIKLSCETAQKLAEEDLQAKSKTEDPSNTPQEEQKKNKQESNQNRQQKSEVSLQEKEDRIHESESVKSTEPKDDDTSGDSSSSWGDYAAYVTYEGDEAIYTDPSTQQKYTWNKSTNAWDTNSGQSEVPGRVYSYENDKHTYTDADGSKCFWDAEKKAWLPKVDDDFLALYQMSYGFVDNTTKPKEESKEDKKKENESKSETTAGVKRKSDPQWFQPAEETNTKVYVSNLPQDLTEEEFVELMQKFGLVERDLNTQKMKIKLYMDKEQNCFKGDALCTYIKIESVDLALKLLDGSDYKGNKIKVERAHFQLKGEYNPALKPKKKKKKELEKLKKMQQKLFDWRPEKFIGERSKHERIVIVKNLFHPSDFDKDVQLILDYQQDLREECSKSGEVRKVVIYDRHPEGVAQITMKDPEQADAVVQLINGRWFGKKQITAEIFDGRTKYRIAETDADINKRIDKWGKFLEGKEDEAKETITEDTKKEPIDASTGDAKKEPSDLSTDNAKKGQSDLSTDDAKKEPSAVSTDDAKKEPSDVSTDDAKKEPSDVSTDNAKKEPSDVSTDNAKKGQSDLSTDNAKKEPSDVSTDDAKKEPSDVSTDNAKKEPSNETKVDDNPKPEVTSEAMECENTD